MLTIAYITSRKEPHIEWFWHSLLNQATGNGVKVVVVDFYHDQRDTSTGIWKTISEAAIHVPPKPTVWQGPHRLTKEDWFAVANARNTALCLAPEGWIAYVDDVSVLMPGWLAAVRAAMEGNYIACGAYKKVRQLQVREGAVLNYDEFFQGIDTRWPLVKSDPSPAEPGWLFGCSCALPVEALLAINGWPEDLCDGLGFEDCCTGIVLANAGFKLMYDRRMLTLESEEEHHVQPAMRKEDWHFEDGQPVLGGNNGDDKSHSALHIAEQSKAFPNHCNFRELRALIPEFGGFPIDLNPQHDWFTKLPLKDL